MSETGPSWAGREVVAADLSGTTLRECDLTGLRVVGSVVEDVEIWPFAGRLGSVRVEGVDVTAYVRAELARRFPELTALDAARTADELREAWQQVLAGWAATRARAADLPAGVLRERVDGEWSYVETLRHLVFATDLWASRMLEGAAHPYHPWGLTHTDADVPDARDELGLDRGADPSVAEVDDVLVGRQVTATAAFARLTDADLDQPRTGVVAEVWGEQSRSAGDCVRTVLREHAHHRRYAERDLDRLTSPA